MIGLKSSYHYVIAQNKTAQFKRLSEGFAQTEEKPEHLRTLMYWNLHDWKICNNAEQYKTRFDRTTYGRAFGEPFDAAIARYGFANDG